MSEDKTTQTATTDADDPAKPDDEAKGAPEATSDEFEKDLAEFAKTEAKSSQPEQPKQSEKSDDEIVERVTARVRTRVEAERDEEALYKQIQGDLPESVAKHVKGFVRERVESDPALMKVWLNRRENPDLYKRMATKLAEEFTSPFKNRPDAGATETKELVAHAVRGASTKAPEGKAPDYSNMTDAEFRAAVKKEHGFTPL
jgi:hypothetical protein